MESEKNNIEVVKKIYIEEKGNGKKYKEEKN